MNFIPFDGNVYIQDGYEYYVYDGLTLSTVQGYDPLIAIAIGPLVNGVPVDAGTLTGEYVNRADGAFLYDAAQNALVRVSKDDLRGLTGRPGPNNFALAAPVALVYVVDFERQRMKDRPADSLKYAHVDCGFVGQNVYLHCAASGLNTVFLGSLKPTEIASALGLPQTRVPLFAQTVGKRP